MWLLKSCIRQLCTTFILLHHMSASHTFALICTMTLHIDSTNEEQVVQEQPLIEEPEDDQEDPQPTTDPITKETNPNKEGR